MDGARFESLHVSMIGEVETALRALTPVSYTHLTLPTKA